MINKNKLLVKIFETKYFLLQVRLLGDGMSGVVSIGGRKLENKDTLISIASDQSLPGYIKTTRPSLENEVSR